MSAWRNTALHEACPVSLHRRSIYRGHLFRWCSVAIARALGFLVALLALLFFSPSSQIGHIIHDAERGWVKGLLKLQQS